MKTCGQCGYQNVDEARFCVRCGASLPEAGEVYAAPAQAPAPDVGTPPVPPPHPGYPGAAQPPGHEAYPPAGTQAAPGCGMATAPPRAAAAYPAKAGGKEATFWVGGVVMLAAGLLVFFSSFMTWIKGPLGLGSVSGWDLVVNKLVRIDNGFFDYGHGYPMFSGLNTIILGALVLLLVVVALAARAKWPGVLCIIFSIVALGIAVVNISSILRGPGGMDIISPGAGLILLVPGSLLGVVGGGMCLAR